MRVQKILISNHRFFIISSKKIYNVTVGSIECLDIKDDILLCIEYIKSLIGEDFSFYLYGSLARNNPNRYPDVDVTIIIKDNVSVDQQKHKKNKKFF